MPSILIIDDDEGTRLGLAELVEQHFPAMEYRCAGNYDQAMAELAGLPPAVIVIDIRMPRVDGFHMMRLIGARDRAPMITMTADARDSTRDQAFATGAYAFLEKPLDRRTFLTAVKYAMEYPRDAWPF